MAAYLTHLFGGTEPARVEALRELIAELDRADGEHTDVSIEDESGWGLSAYATGLLVWENVEGDEPPVQLSGVSRERMIELFVEFVEGHRDAVASLRQTFGMTSGSWQQVVMQQMDFDDAYVAWLREKWRRQQEFDRTIGQPSDPIAWAFQISDFIGTGEVPSAS